MGGGKMGEALLSGLITAGWAKASELAVVEKIPGRRDELVAAYPEVDVADSVPNADGAVVAVKPGDVEGACRSISARRVLSIAAGVRLASLESWLGDSVPVGRAMPNTPALVGGGGAAIAPGPARGADDLDWAEGILSSVGTVVRVPESLLDAVTGLSGSGPAYVFLVAEAMTEAGVLAGLPRDVSASLTVQTLLGSARLLAETGDGPEVLRAAVTSPGGTTAAGLRALEQHGGRAGFLDAVDAATARLRRPGPLPQ